jgi:hypothetical protein
MTEGGATTLAEVPAGQEPFDGYIACACGKVRVDIMQPRSSNFVPPTAALCQCTDCYGFAKAVAQYRQEHHLSTSPEGASGVLLESNAINARQIYKSDAVQVTGEEYLRAIKLTDKSPAVRYYVTCCGTPLLLDYTAAPFFIVYQSLIHPNEKSTTPFQAIPPTVVLNHSSAPPDSPPTPEGIPVREGLSFGFVSHAIARAVVGLVTGKRTSPIAGVLEKVPVSVGLESIGKSPAQPGETQESK